MNVIIDHVIGLQTTASSGVPGRGKTEKVESLRSKEPNNSDELAASQKSSDRKTSSTSRMKKGQGEIFEKATPTISQIDAAAIPVMVAASRYGSLPPPRLESTPHRPDHEFPSHCQHILYTIRIMSEI
jgi:hypothetical protein